jgi:hypothetical protein
MLESIQPLLDEPGGQSLFGLLPIAAKDPFLLEQTGYFFLLKAQTPQNLKIDSCRIAAQP